MRPPTKTAVGEGLGDSVVHLGSDAQMLFLVADGLGVLPQGLMGQAKVTKRTACKLHYTLII